VSEKFVLLQVDVVGPHVPVHQAVAVPFDRGRFVIGRLAEQLRQRAVVLRRDRGRFGERRRAFRRAVLLHGNGHVRVLLCRDVMWAARQLGLLPFLPHAESDYTQRSARYERQQTQQQRKGTRTL